MSRSSGYRKLDGTFIWCGRIAGPFGKVIFDTERMGVTHVRSAESVTSADPSASHQRHTVTHLIDDYIVITEW